jgi:hypothetical protein
MKTGAVHPRGRRASRSPKRKRHQRPVPRRSGPWAELEPGDEPHEVDVADFGEDPLTLLPRGAVLHLFADNCPELEVARSGREVHFHFTEHIYTKFWEHKFHARTFIDAMVRAVRRMIDEGVPFTTAEIDDDDDVHLFIRWTLSLDAASPARTCLQRARDAYDAVWQRANAILEDSDSVLVLGADSGKHLSRLQAIKRVLEEHGYYVYLVKEQPDRLGESTLQKVLRHALSSRFVVVENSCPSGHLYEVPHVAKMAECVTAVLQQRGRGATWMFEDAYFRHKHWRKFSYELDRLTSVVLDAATWARRQLTAFEDHQRDGLPWMKPTVAEPSRRSSGKGPSRATGRVVRQVHPSS